MSEYRYPEPAVNLETAPYWDAAQSGKLLLKRCNACGQTHFYPRAICPNCFSDDTVWYEASGQGRIYSYSVMRRVEQPYVIAYVTLTEGVTMLGNIVDCEFDAVAIDQPVEVTFRPTLGNRMLPVFRLVPTGRDG